MLARALCWRRGPAPNEARGGSPLDNQIGSPMGIAEECQAGVFGRHRSRWRPHTQSNENDRGMVRKFMSSWDAWARKTGCTVLIISHPAKSNYRRSRAVRQTGTPHHGSCGPWAWNFSPGRRTHRENGSRGNALLMLEVQLQPGTRADVVDGISRLGATSPESQPAQWWKSGGRNQGQEQMQSQGADR